MRNISLVFQLRNLIAKAAALSLVLALSFFLIGLVTEPVEAQTGTAITAPSVEMVEDEDLGIWVEFTQSLIAFQRRVNAEVATAYEGDR